MGMGIGLVKEVSKWVVEEVGYGARGGDWY